MTAVGGGAQTLTADLAARAIIAAAQAYGDSPVRACEVTRGPVKRSLMPAALGIADALDLPPARVLRVLGLNPSSIVSVVRKGGDTFARARRAAMRAAEYATWEPDAAESLAGEDLDEVAGDGPQDDLADDRPLQIPAEFDEAMVEPGGCAPRVFVAAAPAAAPQTEYRPPVDFRREPPVPQAEQPLDRLVLEALRNGSLTSMGIASLIGRKEMPVSSTLARLQADGLVVSEPVADGPRKLAWRLAA